MSRVFRFIAEIANLFHGAFGSGIKRPFSREALENLVGPVWTRIILSIPVITVTAWIGIYVAAKVLDLPDGENPFTWFRQMFGQQ